MAVQVVKQTVEKDVVMLTEPDAEFVSLVKHGANRMPFRVVKSQQKGGENGVVMAVHSILLPTGVKLENLAAKAGRQWLSEARTEKSEQHDGYVKLEQAPLTKFDQATLQMVNLGEGALAIVGKLQQDVKADGVLTVGTDVAQKLMLDSPLDQPMDVEVSAEVMAQMAPSFGQLLDMEVGSMMNVIYGSLQQSGADAKSRKAGILKAVDSFKSFLTTALDSIGSAKVDRNKPVEDEEDEAGKKEGGLKSMFESKEQFVEAVGQIVDGRLTAFGEALKKELAPKTEEKPAETPKAETTEPNIADMISKAVAAAVQPLTEKVEALSAKTEKIGSQLGTEPASTGNQDPEPAAKSEEAPKDEKKSVFSGLLTGQALTKQQVAQQF